MGCQSSAVPVPICELVALAFGTDWNEAAAVTKRMTEQSQQTQPPSAKGGCPIRSWQEKDDLTSVCVKLQHKPGAHKIDFSEVLILFGWAGLQIVMGGSPPYPDPARHSRRAVSAGHWTTQISCRK